MSPRDAETSGGVAQEVLAPMQDESYFPDPLDAAHERLLSGEPQAPVRPQPTIPMVQRQGWIYFIEAGDESPIKVGWALDVEKRMDNLQIGHWTELRCIGRLPGTQQDEGDIQARLRDHKIRGEWFERGAALEVFAEMQAAVKPTLRRVQ